MSAFNVDAREYLDICICMLMDFVRHAEEFVVNDRWDEFIKRMMILGLKGVVYPLYLKTDPDIRIKYKMLAKALRGNDTCYIKITPVPDEETQDLAPAKEINKDLVKKIFRKVKQVRYRTSMPITEERLDKIIDYVVKQHNEERGDING